MAQALASNYNHFGCKAPVVKGVSNCTAEEISSLQWGSLGVTNNPNPATNAYYVPKSTSTALWGQPSWLPFGVMTDVGEYPQQTAPQQKDWQYLSSSAVQAMMTRMPTTGSLASTYSWQQFLIPYFLQNQTTVAKYEAAWGNNVTTDIFVEALRARIETAYFGGAFADIKLKELFFGFENTFAAGVSSGDYILGNDYSLSNWTTPIMTD